MEVLKDEQRVDRIENEEGTTTVEVSKEEIDLIKKEFLAGDPLGNENETNVDTTEGSYTEDYENIITTYSVDTVTRNEIEQATVSTQQSYLIILQPVPTDCPICSLLEKSFEFRTLVEQHLIIQTPRPTPDLLTLNKTRIPKFFNNSVYDNIPWICGCRHLSKLYCWPCLLFSTEMNVWAKKGLKNLSGINIIKIQHENSVQHISACIKFKLFRNQQVQGTQVNVEKHNKIVMANRYILYKLIDAICFFSLQEFNLQANSSQNEESIVKILHLLASSDSVLKQYLDQSELVHMLNDLQRCLTRSISNVLLNEIKREIRVTRYISIIVEDFGDIYEKSHKSVVFRYLTETGRVVERFVGLVEDSEIETTDGVVNTIQKYLTDFECTQKLIAFSYDGSVAACGKHATVQSRIKELCPQSLFVPSYSQNLNLIYIQSLKFIKECKIFFDQLAAFSKFFSTFTKRSSALQSEVLNHIPLIDDECWDCTKKLSETLISYKFGIKNLLSNIIQIADKWDSDIATAAVALAEYMEEYNFNFLLNTFSQIFSYSDGLFNFLQLKAFDIECCNKNIEDFVKFLGNKKNYFDVFWSQLNSSNYSFRQNSFKRLKLINTEVDRKTTYKLLYHQIIDVLILCTMDRFEDLKSMTFITLLDVKQFNTQSRCPSVSFESLSPYKTFDSTKLQYELVYLYNSKDLPIQNLISLKEFIVKNELTDVLSEVDNLITLIFTFPKINLLTESPVSTLARLKVSHNKDLPLLAMMSTEKKLLSFLKDSNLLHNAVIDDLAKTESRFALNYQK